MQTMQTIGLPPPDLQTARSNTTPYRGSTDVIVLLCHRYISPHSLIQKTNGATCCLLLHKPIPQEMIELAHKICVQPAVNKAFYNKKHQNKQFISNSINILPFSSSKLLFPIKFNSC
jgi:hypothetical protein